MEPTYSNPKPDRLLRVLPSLADVVFLMPLVFLFARMQGVKTLLSDGDTGWHIRTGEWMLAHHAVVRTDPFSFTKPGQPWFAWEWLWDIGAAWLFQKGGLELVVLASLLVICLTFALLYRVTLRRCGNPLVAAAVALVAASGSTMHWLARPHLFTLFFTVVFLAVLDSAEAGRKKALLWLPLLAILWTNLHGGFIGGILMVLAYAAGEGLHVLLAEGREERSAAIRSGVWYTATAALCAAASLVNPYFYHLHEHIWQYLRDPRQTAAINEFQPVNFQLPAAGFLEGMLIAGCLSALWFFRHRRYGPVVLLAGWAHLALLMGRNAPIFLIVATPAIAEAATAWLGMLERARLAGWARKAGAAVRSAAAEMAPMEAIGRVHVVPVAALLVLAVAMASPHAGLKLRPEYDEKAYPAAALSMLASPLARVFTPDDWGDYLIYRLAPTGGKVFVDGRSDFYGGEFSSAYVDILGLKAGWQDTLARYGVNTVLLPPDAPLAGALRESCHWRIVYGDTTAVIFQPVLPLNQIQVSVPPRATVEQPASLRGVYRTSSEPGSSEIRKGDRL